MQTRFWACLIENTFAGETMAGASIDIELPVGSRGAHFVSKSGQLFERHERVRIAMKNEDLGLNCVLLRRHGAVEKPVQGNDAQQGSAGASKFENTATADTVADRGDAFRI